MRINSKKYFEAAEKLGLNPYQLTFGSSTETSVEVFNGEVENQQIGTSQDIGAKALLDGKMGSFGTDAIDEKTPSIIANSIYESALFGREEKAENFFKGGLKYKKAKNCFKDFKPATLTELREFALELCKKVQARDSRITKTSIGVSMITGDDFKTNNLGLKCSEKTAVFVGYISIVAENENKEPRSGDAGFKSFHNLEELMSEADKVIDEAVHSAVDFFGSGAVKSKKYKAVLSPDSVASLLGFLMGQLNAKSVHKHLSVFEGKVGEKILSDKLTIKHTPHATCNSATSYDSDGYPTQDFTVIEKGVLKTYFHSLETAHEEGIESNGCSEGNGNAGPIVLSVNHGKLNEEQLFQKMKNGLYITSITGLNSGINGQTLDYSLPCAGYVIRDGKKCEAVSMIVCAGNLKDLFGNVVAVGKEVKNKGSFFVPSILFRNFSVSGK